MSEHDFANLPNSWAIATVAQSGTVITGNTPPTSEQDNYGGTLPFIKPPHLQELGIHTSDQFLTERGASLSRVLPPFSVLVSCIGNLGKTGINRCPVAFNQQINAIVPSEAFIPLFLFYQAQSPRFRQQLESRASATTISIVNKGNFETIRLAIPPLAEQRRIVGKIEALFSELDAGVANLKQARAQLAVYRQALLKHAFEGNFPSTKVGSVCSIQSGNGFPLEFQGRSQGELGFFKVGDISRNWQAKRIMLAHAEHYISKSEADSLKAKTLPAGSVVFAKIGAAVALNRRAILEVDSLVDNNVMGLIPGGNLSSRFLFYFMCQIDLGAKTRGGNVPSLRRGDLEEIDMPLPSQSEQDEIVAGLEQRLSVVTALQSDIDLNLQKAEALRQSILKKAFAGKLVPQDPADEPAAALLARIRAEREAAAAKSAKKKSATPRRAKA